MLDFNYSTIQAGRIVRSIGYSAANMSVCADANIIGTFLHFFGRTKFIINFIKVDYKISTMVAFCPGWSFVRVVFSPGLAFLVVFCPVVFCPVVFCPGFFIYTYF